MRTAKARGPAKALPSCAHWPLNVRHEGYYRGAFEVGPELARDGEGAEAAEDASPALPPAKAEDLAKFLNAAIGQFERRYAISAEEKLQALHKVMNEPG